MTIELKIPSPGESITEVEIAAWLVEDGSYVEKDQEVAEIESDKATLPLIAEQAGSIKILVTEGESIKVGSIACTIDTSAERPAGLAPKEEAPVQEEIKKEEPKEVSPKKEAAAINNIKATPLAKKMMEEENLSVDDILNGLKKITSKEVQMVSQQKGSFQASAKLVEGSRHSEKEKMTSLRKKLSKRLVAVKNETAMLTTFNEVDMSRVIALRKKHQKAFVEKHGVKLGFMSFFTMAATKALMQFPKVNSYIEEESILRNDFVDIAIAVQTDKGLMVPVLRNTETMGLADIESNIIELAQKARSFKLSIEEMTGGTFTITNGGIFGSMLSTPIINPPQSAILGMHNIVERPVAIDGRVEIRPIMYLALSYDHRIIDGRDSVSFLVKVKELIEAPEKMLFGDKDPESLLLEI